MYSFTQRQGLTINNDYLDLLHQNSLSDFTVLKNYTGGTLLKDNVFRSVMRFELDGRTFYLKRHFWPYRKKIKSILPYLKNEDAVGEWKNILLLSELGFNTMTPVAFGEKKRAGIPVFSLTLTEDIYDAEKLENYFPANFTPPLTGDKIMKKRTLIRMIAALAADLHEKGLNHQDFYMGHLLIRSPEGPIFIIDLQRMHRRTSIRRLDRIKDLAQVAYSARCTGVMSKSDFMRFAHTYFGTDKLSSRNRGLIKSIMAKERRIAKHDAKLKMRRLIASSAR